MVVNWPTRSQSLVLGIAGSIATGAWCLLQANPMFGLLACAVLVIPGGYIALFHSDRYIAFTCALAVLVGGLEATRLFLNGQAVIAVTGGIIVLELNIGVPLAFLLVVRALMADLMQADTDPLTGLLNRRAFTHAAVRRVQTATEDASLTVAVVDLDRFKAVNDSFGHAGGDAALVAVASALRSVSGDTALLCRMGGEEFVVADVTTGTTSVEAPTHWGRRMRDAVAAIEFPVTASVGIATTAVGDVRAATAEQVLQHMVAEADEAMYCAKRRGGNQAYHAGQNANN